jgi:two-component system sensor histidine kinase MprB
VSVVARVRGMSLRARMGLVAGAAVALAVVAVAAAAYEGTRSQLQSQLDGQLRGLAQPWIHRASGGGARPEGGGGPGPIGGGPPGVFLAGGSGDCDHGLGINRPGAQPLGGATGVTQLITPSGALCKAPTSPRIPFGTRARELARSGHGSYFTDSEVADRSARVLVTALPGGYGALMIALSQVTLERALHEELLLVIAIGAGGIAIAVLLGFLVARTGLAPIARFTRKAERIAASPERVEHERLEIEGSDELARLGATFNAMLDALEASIASQRNLIADASHELRTPIASVRANLQLLRDEALLPEGERAALRRDMIEELDELTRLVEDVVELARGTKPPAEPGEVRLDLIVEEALERARRRAPGVNFEAALEPALVRGDGARVARAITNLLDNAAKWSPAGGTVEVSLSDGVVSVLDHGPGFHEEDLPHVFDRFHRARDARGKPGSGLGLAIVRQAAVAHGGFVQAGNAPGGGALMRIGFGPAGAIPEPELPDGISSAREPAD